MRKTKKISLAAILSALGVTFMYLGAFIQVLDLSVVAIASALVVFARIEIGTPYDWAVYLVTGTLSLFFLFNLNPLIPVLYFLFAGMYPILKAYFERLPRRSLSYLVKGVYFALIVGLLLLLAVFFSEALFGAPLFTGKLLPYTSVLLAALYVLLIFMCFVYDLLLSQLVVIYMVKIRPKIATILK
ncbi:MAG: hypothetical protein IKC43_01455 [Clostridia bacterium]|nr:hypothetical protein [Clostridia bacterium]